MVQKIEAVAFDPELFYDALQYFTNAGKLRNCVGGLKWFDLTRNKPVRRFKIGIKRKVKAMNPYTFYGVLVGFPKIDTFEQYHANTETTDVSHIFAKVTTRYKEWNLNFNMEAV